MKNMKISQRLVIGFGAVVLIVLVLGVVSVAMMIIVDSNYSHLIDYPVVRYEEISEVETDFMDARRAVSHMGSFAGLPGASDTINSMRSSVTASLENIKTHLAEYDRLIQADPVYTAAFKQEYSGITNKMRALLNDYETQMVEPFSRASLEGRREDAVAISTANAHIPNEILDIIADLKSAAIARVDEENEATGRLADITVIALVILAVIAVGASILFAVIIEKSVVHSLKESMHTMEDVTHTVASSSRQLSQASHTLADNASNQAASIEETSATMNETASMLKLTKENTQHAARLSSEAAKNTVDSMTNVSSLMDVMNKLSESSARIEKIADLINSLASQTNILALNASVEAVRVGEAGRGFAVVAEEVRELATKSANAAHSTTDIIKENIALAIQGVENSKAVSLSLNGVNEDVRQINMLLSEISTATEEQSMGVDQLAAAISQMEQATQSSAAVAEESSAAADELLVLSDNLTEIEENIEAMI
jgi:methyl-accepting chemotaxis protein